jgi:hypothetical protein
MRSVLLAVIAVILGTVANYALLVVVGVLFGISYAEGVHSEAAVVLVAQPIFWVAAFVLLYRSNFLRPSGEPKKPIHKN